MSSLNIVLVEPRIPQNTGNIARTCAATGCALHLVHPMGFDIDDAKLKRAGLDYWHLLNITYHNSLEAFLESADGDCFFYSTKARRTHSEVAYPDNPYLVFGREDAGLPEELLLSRPEQCVRIPILSEARSLNLSNAAAIAAYEVLRQWDYPKLSANGQLTRYRWPSPSA
jgi:Predicted rRNA methylase (SpoU class)